MFFQKYQKKEKTSKKAGEHRKKKELRYNTKKMWSSPREADEIGENTGKSWRNTGKKWRAKTGSSNSIKDRFKVNRSKRSILNAIFALLQMVITSIFGLMLSRSIMSHYGSDYNGINSIVTQVVNAIMVLEGGFTLASNVALFKPFFEKNIKKINGILSATKKRFRMISLIAVLIGIIIAFLFPFCISTGVSYITCVCMMLSVLLPSCFNLGYSMKYRVILLTDQKEYVISMISTLFYVIGNSVAILLIQMNYSILIVRLVIMIFLFWSYYSIGLFCRKKYRFLQFTEKPLFNEIRGSKNVLVMKATSMLYSSMPIMLISTLSHGGAMLASVYAVYRNVITVVQSSLTSITNAPRLGFGSLFAEGKYKEAEDMFYLYEKIAFISMSIILGTTCLLIMPFIDLYTRGITDINYHNIILACMMLVTVFFEICHIPSGQMIQMSGSFEASKNIQLVAFIVLAAGMVVGRMYIGLYGILAAVLLAAVVLCVLEIGYTRRKIFEGSLVELIINMFPCIIICIIASLIGFSGIISCENYIIFIIEGVIVIAILSAITLGFYAIIDVESIKRIFSIVKNFLKKANDKQSDK